MINPFIDQANKLLSQAFRIVEQADSREEMRQAAVLLESAVRCDPAHPDAWNELAFVQAQLGAWPRALHAAHQALKLGPSNPKFIVGYYGKVLDAFLEGHDEGETFLGVAQAFGHSCSPTVEEHSETWCTFRLDRLEAIATDLTEHFASYPSVYALKANVIALRRPHQQSEWEEQLAKFAEAYESRRNMQSSAMITQEGVCAALLHVTMRCLEYATFSSRQLALQRI